MLARLLDVRNDRRNAAGDEEVARTAAQQDGRVHPRVAAGDHKRLGTLAVHETAEEFALAKKVVFLEVVKALNEVVKVLHDESADIG